MRAHTTGALGAVAAPGALAALGLAGAGEASAAVTTVAGVSLSVNFRGLLLGTPIGNNAIISVAWCAGFTVIGYTWAVRKFGRGE